jgi:hypothetical protein
VAVADDVVDPGGRPFQVVVELDPQGEQRLLVDEVRQPVGAVQVGQETEVTGWVPHSDQVLHEGHLHGRVIDQHSAVPAELALAFEEEAGDRLGAARALVLFGDRDRQGEVRRPEADSDHVVDGYRCVRCEFLWHYCPLLDVDRR